jgi:uncharacterized membrane protein YccC
MTIQVFLRPRLLLRSAFRPLLDPARRFRRAKLIHAGRVALGVLLSILVTSGISVPHGEWATITVLIVIGGLQHHGNIRRKAAERALGTLIGATVGLAVIVQQSYFHLPVLSYLLIVVACGICAYHAIGKGGYIALLSAITILIIAGHGDNAIIDGMWRAVNVLIGIAIALLFSFALPLYATYSWRYTLARALRGCAQMHTAIATGAAPDIAQLRKALVLQGSLLVQLRSLMPWVAKEIDVSTEQLEAIQHGLRICISLLEVLATTRPQVNDDDTKAFIQRYLSSEHHRLGAMLIGVSRALQFGTLARLQPRRRAVPVQIPGDMPVQLAGYLSLTLRLSTEFDELRQHVAAIADHWNI